MLTRRATSDAAYVVVVLKEVVAVLVRPEKLQVKAVKRSGRKGGGRGGRGY